MMKDVIKNTVLKPLLERLGTVAAALLVFGGDWVCQAIDACGLVTKGGAEMVMTYVIAVALLMFDLIVSWMNRKAEIRKAEIKVVNNLDASGRLDKGA